MARTEGESRIAAEEAVRLYRDEDLSTRDVAARLGVSDKKVRGWLRSAGVTRPRGPRPAVDPDEVRAARKTRRQPWSQVAADLGISETAAKKAYRRGYGDAGKVDRHAHLTGAQRAELGHAWDTLPRAANGGHDTACEEGRRLIGRMCHFRRAGVTGAEIAAAIGVSRAYASALMAREATPPR